MKYQLISRSFTGLRTLRPQSPFFDQAPNTFSHYVKTTAINDGGCVRGNDVILPINAANEQPNVVVNALLKHYFIPNMDISDTHYSL
ncbi:MULTISPECIES: hypothetical protein [Burkholderiaceae]|uniref:hypothetical protein n=1 Tax=Burkholderiaceae TaxID=119060 RepID=UPI000AC85EED|nr:MULTISPECIES: hypothetical protein [Burkholderiaceae]